MTPSPSTEKQPFSATRLAACAAYLAQDRLQALAHDTTLADRATGTVLFADISGFTPLTEHLALQLGVRRGAETLSQHINTVYAALITTIEQYGGSVVGLAGDALMCWFDEAHGPPAARAARCALQMQTALQPWRTLTLSPDLVTEVSLKVALASGPVRRFVVGEPTWQVHDTLAGVTLERVALGEQLTQKGEVVIDAATRSALGAAADIAEQRVAADGTPFGVLRAYAETVTPTPWPPVPADALAVEQLRPYLLPAVYARELAGHGAFLTEFRPCVTLFVRFTGIAYEAPEAEARLSAFVRQGQAVAHSTGGTVLDLTIGDKGSYLYMNFGALNAHEDDARRALKAALALREAAQASGYLAPVQIGITQGVLRVGAYGGLTRRTYSALGDEVNLAARLMMAAAPGEILVTARVQAATRHDFAFAARLPLKVKGKSAPVPVFVPQGPAQRHTLGLQEPHYALPLVGRQAELAQVDACLAVARSGQAQLIGLVAEAGVGKSRLAAEIVARAQAQGFVGYGGACLSDGLNAPYLVWKAVWQALYEVEPTWSLKQTLARLTAQIAAYAPERISALPLLNMVLDLAIPENDFTRHLEPQQRQGVLHALLEDCLRAATRTAPVLIVLEDLHWIDAVSHDLLEQLARALTAQAVCFVLAYRPAQLPHTQGLVTRLEALSHFTKLALSELTGAEAAQAIHAKLAHVYPTQTGPVPAELVEKLIARAQGNPFYLEELVNDLHDRGLDPYDPRTIHQLELPVSLHSLILSRIDRLTEYERTTLRVASIIGRLFRAAWLIGYYPALGAPPQVEAALAELQALDITPLDTPAQSPQGEPELVYLFKHIVTHEVTYESLPYATRAKLHEQLAHYLETTIDSAQNLAHLDVLAFHYGRSANSAKQREYFQRAGAAAQARYANATALDYYGRLLPLLETPAMQIEIYLERGKVCALIGQWPEAEADYRAALARALAATSAQARAQAALGKLSNLRGDYTAALVWLTLAHATQTALGEHAGLAQTLIEMGQASYRLGEYADAQTHFTASLTLARTTHDTLNTAAALTHLGYLAQSYGDEATAQTYWEESLAVRRALGDKGGTALVLNGLGGMAYNRGHYAVAQARWAESLVLRREVGDKAGCAASLNNLGLAAYNQGDHATARALYTESLALKRALGDKWGIGTVLINLGLVMQAQGDDAAAHAFYTESLALSRAMNSKMGISTALINLGNLALAQGDIPSAHTALTESLTLCTEMDDHSSKAYALLGLGLVRLVQGAADAETHIRASLQIRVNTGEQLPQTSSLIACAGLALHAGHLQRAAQLLGAVDAALKLLAADMEPEMKWFYARTLAAVQAPLGAAAYATAWAEGARLSLAEAAQSVLQETGVAETLNTQTEAS